MPKKTNAAEAARLREIAFQQRAKVVDEFGRLDSDLAPIRSKIRRHEDLARVIRSWFVEEKPESTHIAEGTLFDVVAGPAGMQTHMANTAQLYQVLGHDAFLKAASLTLRSLEAVIEPAIVASLTWKERTGARTLAAAKREEKKAA